MSPIPLICACTVSVALVTASFAAETTSPRASKSSAPIATRTTSEIQAAYDKAQAALERDHKNDIEAFEKQIQKIRDAVTAVKQQIDKLQQVIAKIDEVLPKLLQSMSQEDRDRARTLEQTRKAHGKELQERQREIAELQAKLMRVNRQKETLTEQFQKALVRLRQEREQTLKGARR